MESKNFSKNASRFLLIGLLISILPVLSAQKATDYSGTWIMDIAKSDANYGQFYSKVTCVIKQTAQTITIQPSFVMKGNDVSTPGNALTYSLDGKESVKEEQGGIDKHSAKWLSDGKVLNLKYVRTMNGSDFGSIESYTLSENGQVLNVKTTDLNGESSIVQVYRKE